MRRFFLLLPFLLSACVDSYEPRLALSADVLVVEGTLSDLSETQFVRISRSIVINGQSSTLALKGVKGEVFVDGGTPVSLRETSTGRYELPPDFRAQVGHRYQLRFRLSDGKQYESTEETMRPVSRIEKVYDEFDEKALPNATRTQFAPANLIYLDTQDPPGERNYYRWSWTLWEAQTWCASCQRGIFIVDDPLTGDGTCVGNRFIDPGQIYDYNCNAPCWDVFQGFDLNLFTDTYSNGNSILGRLVAKIPYFQAQAALVEIRQYALTAGAYRYFKLFEDQAENTGGLADTPPAPIVGNVRSLSNDRENVVGYFTASGTSSVKYWLDRRNATTLSVGLFYSLFGRQPIPEPTSVTPKGEPRPPFVRCVPGETRTPLKPEGWR